MTEKKLKFYCTIEPSSSQYLSGDLWDVRIFEEIPSELHEQIPIVDSVCGLYGYDYAEHVAINLRNSWNNYLNELFAQIC